jgi:hypothetical protein
MVFSVPFVPGLYNELNFEQQSDNRWGSTAVRKCWLSLGTIRESRESGKFILVSRYQATANEDYNRLRRPSVPHRDL